MPQVEKSPTWMDVMSHSQNTSALKIMCKITSVSCV